ncbi:MAG: hypothetical protein N2044_01300 [Cyclobacteriaceae bacterium]|nr:hypothetical protein [Cyclobacteriaceae bacterium]MCX7636458.1 hypothetical protein [Cyclobacteriaceae bacterium]
MKRLIAIGLLTVFGFMLGGVYVYFAVRLTHIRHQMRQQLAVLPSADLECLELTPDEFVRFKVDDHELKINGRMFDIARVIRLEEYVMVYGLYDAAEDNLLGFIRNIFLRIHNDDDPLPVLLVSLYKMVYHLPDTDLILMNPVMLCKAQKPYLKNFKSPLLKLLTPPPRFSNRS